MSHILPARSILVPMGMRPLNRFTARGNEAVIMRAAEIKTVRILSFLIIKQCSPE